MVYCKPMKPGRNLRSLVAILALLGVLLGQLGIAAYACPIMGSVDNCCMSMDEGEPALCQAHCQQGDQSLDKPVNASLPPAVAVARVVAPQPAASPPREPSSLLARPTAPCAAVRHCRFQI
jgi:hypothetical protein